MTSRRPVAVPAGLAVLVATLIAPGARADDSPLTELVDAAAQRLEVAEPVAAFKWRSHGAVEDPTRVRQELDRLRAEAVSRHIDPDYVAAAFGDQIDATEAVEYNRFADWKLHPQNAPSAAPDLSASRSSVDALNEAMLAQVAENWDLLNSPACAGQLDAARSGVIRDRQLDTLYQQALSAATRSYCQR